MHPILGGQEFEYYVSAFKKKAQLHRIWFAPWGEIFVFDGVRYTVKHNLSQRDIKKLREVGWEIRSRRY